MSPRIRHLRYRHFSRLRHSEVFAEWLHTQATRLSVSEEDIFNLLVEGASSVDIENKAAPSPPSTGN